MTGSTLALIALAAVLFCAFVAWLGRSRATVVTFNPDRYPRWPMPGVVVFRCASQKVGAGESPTIEVEAWRIVRIESLSGTEAGPYRLKTLWGDGIEIHRRPILFNPEADIPLLRDAGANYVGMVGWEYLFDTPEREYRPAAPGGSGRNATRPLSPPPPPPKRRVP